MRRCGWCNGILWPWSRTIAGEHVDCHDEHLDRLRSAVASDPDLVEAVDRIRGIVTAWLQSPAQQLTTTWTNARNPAAVQAALDRGEVPQTDGR